MQSESNDQLTSKLLSNIKGSTVLKGIDVVLNLLLVRYAIAFFGDEDYGLWVTILSFFTWFSVIEFGIGSSFRNKITQLFADKKFEKIKAYTYSGYKYLGLFYLLITLLFIGGFSLSGFNFDNTEPQFKWVFLLSFALYMCYYVFLFLQSVLLATHLTTQTYVMGVIQKMLMLGGVLIFINLEMKPSLMLACLWFSIIPVLVWGVANLISYMTFLKKMIPSREGAADIKPFSEIKWAFILIQISALLIYSTDSIIIADVYSGVEVTQYSVSHKFFNIIIILFNVVLLPYWSSFADAAHKGDVSWIRKNVNHLLKFWFALLLIAVLMVIGSSYAYNWWIGKPVDISLSLSIGMALFVIITCWNNIFVFFLNSIYETKRQLYLMLIAAIVNVPLSYLLLYNYNSAGVIAASCIVLFPLSIGLPLKYKSIISKIASDKNG